MRYLTDKKKPQNTNPSLRGRGVAAPRNQGLLPDIVAGLEKKNDTAAYDALKQAGHIHSAGNSICLRYKKY
jgi:hypothetical protein